MFSAALESLELKNAVSIPVQPRGRSSGQPMEAFFHPEDCKEALRALPTLSATARLLGYELGLSLENDLVCRERVLDI